MPFDRRTLLMGLGATLATSRIARAQTVTDSAGRAVPVPPKVTRVFPAGPPAAITLYTVAPDLLDRVAARQPCRRA
jgi:iron complex transport system substrate-binding protein